MLYLHVLSDKRCDSCEILHLFQDLYYNRLFDKNKYLQANVYVIIYQSELTITQIEDTPTFAWVIGDY